MAKLPKRSFWQTCRVYFRRGRIAFWLVILALVGAALYLNQVGLPDVIKNPLLDRLRAHGLDLQFTRLRLSWYRGIVAENVRFGQADEPMSPHLNLEEVRVELNHQALRHLQVQVDALELRRGRLTWPVSGTNQPPRQLVMENVQTHLRFLPEDEWALDNFRALFNGVKIQMAGTVTHASAVRDWPYFQTQPAAGPRVPADRLERIAETLERIRFAAQPEIRFDLRGDGRDPRSFFIRLMVSAAGAHTPWGSFSQGRLSARLLPATNEFSHALLSLEAAHAQTRWGSTTNLLLNLQLASRQGQRNPVTAEANLTATGAHTPWATVARPRLHVHLAVIEDQTNCVRGTLEWQAAHAMTQWGGATNLQGSAQWIHALTNPVPLSGEGRIECAQANSRWASAKGFRLSARLATPTNSLPQADASWAVWAGIQPYLLEWATQAQEAQVSNLVVQSVACSGNWSAPHLVVSNFQAKLHQRPLEARAALDVATRALRAEIRSSIEPHDLASFLEPGVGQTLAKFTWPHPPILNAQVAVVVPPWTNRPPDWWAETHPTLRVEGDIQLAQGLAYRSVTCSAAQTHVSYSNGCFQLRDLVITRPEGALEGELEGDQRTRQFHSRLSSSIDPNCLRPLLDTNVQAGLDLVHLTQPPILEAEARGQWDQLETLAVNGRVAITNVTFRGEKITGLQTGVIITNQLILLTMPRVQLGTQHLSADSLLVNLAVNRAFLTNGYAVADPMVVTRAIGAQVARAIAPYQFAQPPIAHAYGTIPLHGSDDADLHFQVEGGPFHWWRFNVQHITGNVHWAGQRLALTDVSTEFYGGRARGAATFAFDVPDGTDFQFNLTTTNTLLQRLMADFWPQTNHLEGRLNTELTVTGANTEDWRHTFGYGKVELRDGLIWDIPLFGVFSPVLNGLVPGLGNSRANAATSTFNIANGIIRSEDLEIRAQAVRLQYRGTVALDGQVEARVDSELLRDMWVVGPILSTVFWPVTKMFEYKVTGTLDEPKTHAVFLIPKIVLLPFRPIRTIKELLPDNATGTDTTDPAKR